MPGKNAEPPMGLLYQSPHFLIHAQSSENIIEEGLEEMAEFCDMLPPGHGYHPPELTAAVTRTLASQPELARPQPLLKGY